MLLPQRICVPARGLQSGESLDWISWRGTCNPFPLNTFNSARLRLADQTCFLSLHRQLYQPSFFADTAMFSGLSFLHTFRFSLLRPFHPDRCSLLSRCSNYFPSVSVDLFLHTSRFLSFSFLPSLSPSQHRPRTLSLNRFCKYRLLVSADRQFQYWEFDNILLPSPVQKPVNGSETVRQDSKPCGALASTEKV